MTNEPHVLVSGMVEVGLRAEGDSTDPAANQRSPGGAVSALRRWAPSLLVGVLIAGSSGCGGGDPDSEGDTASADPPVDLAVDLAVELPASEGIHLMPTPVGFEFGAADPFAATPPDERTTRVKVFVVANRRADADASPAEFLTDRRTIAVRLCTLDVDLVPSVGSWQQLVELCREPGRTDGPPIVLSGFTDFGGAWPGPAALEPREELGPEAVDRFAAAIDEAIDRSGGEDLYVYVHGFDTTVPKNAGYAAELFNYLGRRGAIVLFAWPSAGDLFGYAEDKTSARASVRTFRKCLQLLGSRTKAKKIHILAHSAGTPIAIEAIDELRLLNDTMQPRDAGRALRLGRLILAAPDMDFFTAYDALADGATELPERITIYDSRSDRALEIAAWFCGGTRLGRSLGELDQREIDFLMNDANVDVIDVTNAERHAQTWLGHRYFWQNPWVSTDVMLTLLTDANPTDRGLQFDAGRRVHGFGNDYPDRVRPIARELIQAVVESRDEEDIRSDASPAP